MTDRGRVGGVHVALLRGINVGGKNKLPMKDLIAIFTDVGCGDVQTYIQSGNVVFRADDGLAGRVPSLVTDEIAERLGLQIPVMTRTAAELNDVIAGNPFHLQPDPKLLHVAFLADSPSGDAVAALDPNRSPPDEFRVCEREIYLHYPNGVARSKLTNAYFDSKLGTTSTARNWRTVLKLHELAGGS